MKKFFKKIDKLWIDIYFFVFYLFFKKNRYEKIDEMRIKTCLENIKKQKTALIVYSTQLQAQIKIHKDNISKSLLLGHPIDQEDIDFIYNNMHSLSEKEIDYFSLLFSNLNWNSNFTLSKEYGITKLECDINTINTISKNNDNIFYEFKFNTKSGEVMFILFCIFFFFMTCAIELLSLMYVFDFFKIVTPETIGIIPLMLIVLLAIVCLRKINFFENNVFLISNEPSGNLKRNEDFIKSIEDKNLQFLEVENEESNNSNNSNNINVVDLLFNINKTKEKIVI